MKHEGSLAKRRHIESLDPSFCQTSDMDSQNGRGKNVLGRRRKREKRQEQQCNQGGSKIQTDASHDAAFLIDRRRLV